MKNIFILFVLGRLLSCNFNQDYLPRDKIEIALAVISLSIATTLAKF